MGKTAATWATSLLLLAAWPLQAAAQGREEVLHRIELHPAGQARLCIGPATLQPRVRSELAVVACDRERTVFTFVAAAAGPGSAPGSMLVHDESGLCVATREDAAQAGSRLVLDDCAAREPQFWLRTAGDVIHARSRLCVGPASAGGAVNAPLALNACGWQDLRGFSVTRSMAPRTVTAAAASAAPARVPGERVNPTQAAGRQQGPVVHEALVGCGQDMATAGPCLAQKYAGRLLQAGFHYFYINRSGQKQRMEASLLADCGFRPREQVAVDPDVLLAIPSGEPMPRDGAACALARGL